MRYISGYENVLGEAAMNELFSVYPQAYIFSILLHFSISLLDGNWRVNRSFSFPVILFSNLLLMSCCHVLFGLPLPLPHAL